MESLNPQVAKMKEFYAVGSVMPDSWYQVVKNPSGTTNLLAIAVLSEVVHWYSPIEIRDEHTGRIIGFRSKFSGDKLQISYEALAEKFGVSKRQVKDATDRLVALDLIDKEFRTITVDGLRMNNVLFIGIHAEKVIEISRSSDSAEE